MSQRMHWSLICGTTFIVCALLVLAHESWGRNPSASVDSEPPQTASAVEPAPRAPTATVATPTPPPVVAPAVDKIAPELPPPILAQTVAAQPASLKLEAPAVGSATIQPPIDAPAAGSLPFPLPPVPSEAPPAGPPPASPPLGDLSSPSLPPAPTAEGAAPPTSSASSAPPPTSPWTFHVAVVLGWTQVEARSGNDIQLSVTCARLNMQTPSGNLQASGSVKFTGASVEGTCEKLTLGWSDEQVLLEGNVRLKCRQNGQDVDLSGEKLTIKLAAIETIPPPARAATQEMPSAEEAWLSPH